MPGYRAPGPLCVTNGEAIDKGTNCLATMRPPGPAMETLDAWAAIEARRATEGKARVNHKAATRQAIIAALQAKKIEFVARSAWEAKEPKGTGLSEDWDYTGIALHHAGNSYSCDANGGDKMRRVQAEHFKRGSSDIGYHYGIDCQGVVFEGRDIRYLGAHIGQVPKVVGVVLLADMSVRGEQRKVERDLPWWKKSGFGIVPTYDDIAVGHDEPTDSQVTALEKLTEVLKRHFAGITRFGGHREWASQSGEGRACPGVYGLIVAEMVRQKFSLAKP
jgi:N-acetylmuramoyl-L-alanine amidase